MQASAFFLSIPKAFGRKDVLKTRQPRRLLCTESRCLRFIQDFARKKRRLLRRLFSIVQAGCRGPFFHRPISVHNRGKHFGLDATIAGAEPTFIVVRPYNRKGSFHFGLLIIMVFVPALSRIASVMHGSAPPSVMKQVKHHFLVFSQVLYVQQVWRSNRTSPASENSVVQSK